MIVSKCPAVLLSLMVIAINLLLSPLCQADLETGDVRFRRDSVEQEATITQPEDDMVDVFPKCQQSEAVPVNDRILPTHPCYRFSCPDTKKRQFFSPGLEDEKTYRNNTNCTLVLTAPKNKLIELDFRDYFEIEQSPGCKNDFLEVRDGEHGYNNLIGPSYCGSTFPSVIVSSDRFLWIHFKSDENIEYKGFRAVYRFIPRPNITNNPERLNCQIIKTPFEDEGKLSETDIPELVKNNAKEYKTSIDCIWRITVKDKWKIHLQFENFDLHKPNECDRNYVEVFSGDTYISNRKKKFCGSIADPVISDHALMIVRFFDVYEDKPSKFTANWTAFRTVEKSATTQKKECREGEFSCEDDTCISQSLRCNNKYNCRFKWDEEDCPGESSNQSMSFSDDHIVIIMVIFSLILSGMCFTFIFNCVKKLIRDHRTIQEYIRQSREQQLNELDKSEQADKKKASGKSASRSNSTPSLTSVRFEGPGGAGGGVTTPCYVPGGELLPILIRSERSLSPPNNGDVVFQPDIYTVDQDTTPVMCDSACQTRESLFTTQGYSSGNSSPNRSVNTNSPPAPFSTFGYKKDNNKYRAEAKIDVSKRPYSVQTTKSAPDVIVTH